MQDYLAEDQTVLMSNTRLGISHSSFKLLKITALSGLITRTSMAKQSRGVPKRRKLDLARLGLVKAMVLPPAVLILGIGEDCVNTLR